MSVFRCAAYLMPLLAGFGAAWALASTEGRPAPRRLAILGAVLLVCLPFGRAGLVALSLALLVAAAYLAARALRVPAGPAQVVASLLPVALYATLFLFAPVYDSTPRTDADMGRRLTLALELSPISTLAVSVFDDNFYHRPTFYRLDFAAYKHAPPSWTGTVAMYLTAAAALGAIALGGFALRKKAA
ncbi:MAG TPA: hypothetical protein VF950_00860 [Planctomycetota bacterium]